MIRVRRPANAATVGYAPADGAHWPDPDPDAVDGGLDQLADRVDALEGGAAGEANTASSIGGGSSIFSAKNGVDLEFRSVVAGPGTSVSIVGDTLVVGVDVSGAADGEVLTADGAGGAAFEAGGAGGEANTASSIGGGSSIFSAKNGVDLEFRSVVAGPGTSVSIVGDTLTVGVDVTGAADGDVLTADGAGGAAFEAAAGGGVSGAARVTCSANTGGLAVGTAVAFDAVEQVTGFGVTVSGRTVTLPAGAWYSLSFSFGARTTATSGYIDLQLHDVTAGATAIGSRGQWYRPSSTAASGQPPCGEALVDATGGAVDIELRVIGVSLGDYVDDETDLIIIRVG